MFLSSVKKLLQKIYRTDELGTIGVDSFELQWRQDRNDGVKASLNYYVILVLTFACSSVYTFGSPASRLTLVATYILIVSQMLILGVRKLNTMWTSPWYFFFLVQVALIGHAIALH